MGCVWLDHLTENTLRWFNKPTTAALRAHSSGGARWGWSVRQSRSVKAQRWGCTWLIVTRQESQARVWSLETRSISSGQGAGSMGSETQHRHRGASRLFALAIGIAVCLTLLLMVESTRATHPLQPMWSERTLERKHFLKVSIVPNCPRAMPEEACWDHAHQFEPALQVTHWWAGERVALVSLALSRDTYWVISLIHRGPSRDSEHQDLHGAAVP
jgi:hypothetical protein